MKASEEIIKKYQSYISNIEWNIKTNNPPEDVVLREKRRVECYSEIVKDLQQLASHPSPVEYPEAIIANFQPSSPMSAEQVELKKYAGEITARLASLVYRITKVLDDKDKQLSSNGYDLQNEFRKGFMLADELVKKVIDEQSATPSVKADGWEKFDVRKVIPFELKNERYVDINGNEITTSMLMKHRHDIYFDNGLLYID